jgi:CubicO group peptidase (beta-lactamase class C family)
MRRSPLLLIPAAVLLLATGSKAAHEAPAAPDALDDFIVSQMALRHVAGLSIAIIDGGRIITARAYGVIDSAGGARVDTTTLFQAGSVSKSVAAFGVLRLVEQKKLNLDTDVNATLRTWKLPPSEFTATKPVTLRGLLSHTAGTTVHGFGGYAPTSAVPTLVEVLNGTPPANSPPIRSEAIPGARWNYSGGGYTIMQQMVLDVTGQPFPDVMRQTVLEPIGMARSSYQQPLPPAMAAKTAGGHYSDRSLVPGRWHIYPEMAAAGLWTTPSDLARFAIEVQRTYTGKSGKVISPSMARQMLTNERDGDGLGLFLLDTGRALRFNHNGRDDGFDTELTATANTGQGVVIMINANDNSRMVSRIRNFVARQYHWPNASAYVAPAAASLPPAVAAQIAGRYEFANNQMIAFVPRDGRLSVLQDSLPDEDFILVDADHMVSAERNVRYTVVRDPSGAVTGLSLIQGATSRPVPRIGPLFADVVPRNDDDPAVDARADSALRALGAGGAELSSSPVITPGARHDFGTNPWPPAKGLRSLQFVSAQNVEGRNIERHGFKVARVIYYRMITDEGTAMLLVHLTSDGLITDVDEVDG